MNVTSQFACPPVSDRDPVIVNSNFTMNEQYRGFEVPNTLMGDMEPVLLDDLFPVFPDYGIDWPHDGYNI